MGETDESQGSECTHNILSINQSSLGVVAYITNKLRSTLKQHMIIARGEKRIGHRLSYNFHTMYYNDVEIKKTDREYAYAMPIAISVRHTISFDDVHFSAQLRHPVL